MPDLPAERGLSWEAGRAVLVAVSPVPSMRPFVLARPAEVATSFSLPADVLSGHRDVAWYARAFDARTFETVVEARLVASGSSSRDGAPAD